MSVSDRVQEHYTHGGLIEAVETSLRALGKDPVNLKAEDLAQIDELHIGGNPATRHFIAQCAFKPDIQVLDVGSGMGGPARAFALTTRAHITGIDLTQEFVDVAQVLSARLGVTEKATFLQGSALDLPFPDGAFDGAYMIHVGMNIEDKDTLFSQVRRVLKAGSTFGIYDIMKLGSGDLTFPLPWSSEPQTSFVAAPEVYRNALTAAGFEVTAEEDRLASARAFLDQAAAQAASGNPAALAHRGRDFPTKARNLRGLVNAGVLGPRVIIAQAM